MKYTLRNRRPNCLQGISTLSLADDNWSMSRWYLQDLSLPRTIAVWAFWCWFPFCFFSSSLLLLLLLLARAGPGLLEVEPGSAITVGLWQVVTWSTEIVLSVPAQSSTFCPLTSPLSSLVTVLEVHGDSDKYQPGNATAQRWFCLLVQGEVEPLVECSLSSLSSLLSPGRSLPVCQITCAAPPPPANPPPSTSNNGRAELISHNLINSGVRTR